MSEFQGNIKSRSEKLFDFAHRLIDGENGRVLIEKHREVLDSVDAVEAMNVLDRLLREDYPIKKVKDNTGKIINVFYKSLSSFVWEKPGAGHFLHYLMEENRRAEKLVSDVRPYLRTILKPEGAVNQGAIEKVKEFIDAIGQYDLHYIKKENILFPYIEKAFPGHRCLKLMWSFHDDFRRSVKELRRLLLSSEPDTREINVELGTLFFVLIPVIFREEQIVFPVALMSIPESEWAQMLEQSREAGWCFGINPVYPEKTATSEVPSGQIDLGTGYLDAQQIILMMDSLPVDITFVDENDEVRFFSPSKHRTFPRSKAIIGRKVQNCHPPESVHIVNEIIESFRNRTNSHADFWIKMKEKFIHIRYFALYNERGVYKGTIEVSQDVTEIRVLRGEQRLLNWGK